MTFRAGRRRRWGPWRAAALLLMVLGVSAAAAPAGAHELVPGETNGISFTQNVGQQAPLDLRFRDEAGAPVTLRRYFGDRPVILTMNYLRCRNLCSLVIQGLGASLGRVPLQLGVDYAVITVSIDPSDTPEQAAATKSEALASAGQPPASGGWHVLTGAHREIDQLAHAVGFNYGYDADQDEYAHPAGIIVLTPEGRVDRYLYGIDFPPTDVRLALVDAAQGHIGSVIDQALLLCYRYDAETGRYTPLVLSLVRQLAVVTVVGLGGLMGYLWYGDLRSHREPPNIGGSP